MLVLSRRRDEEIVIDITKLLEDFAEGKVVNPVIRVTAVEIRGDKVRLGCTAAQNVGILRNELISHPVATQVSVQDFAHT